MPLDNSSVKTKTELLKSLEKEQLKQHIVRDAQKRPILIFETYISAVEGDPCLATEYVYYLNETEVSNRQERVYKWKAAWDSLYIFDPSADYDPDGDGEL